MNWPNGVTILRMLLVPVLVGVSLRVPRQPSLQWAVLGLVAFMGFTDALDGILARVLKQRTALGTFLDPLADKLFLTAGIVLVACPLWPGGGGVPVARIPDWVPVVVISRDAFIGIGSAVIYMMNGKMAIRPRLVGKLTTCAQIALLVGALIPAFPAPALHALLVAMLVCTVASWAVYMVEGLRQLPRGG
ncbi:MAG: CDP-alcohol phosphatidyltransferase family protein [Planctomycetes bacterium]|nr:CDP-alcohol phosphatidyltransferase family protein [Planctomycetota bacterium]